jgi:hypothetical protein
MQNFESEKETELFSGKYELPEKLSTREEEIFYSYLNTNFYDTSFEDEMEKIKKVVDGLKEDIHKTFSPEMDNPLKKEVEEFLKTKRAEAASQGQPDFIRKTSEPGTGLFNPPKI